MFTGLVAFIFGFGLAVSAAIYSLISLILALVFRKSLGLGVFKQRSGAFLIGGLFQVLSGLFLMVSGTDFVNDSHGRRMADEFTMYIVVGTIFVTVAIIVARFVFVSRRYYRGK